MDGPVGIDLLAAMVGLILGLTVYMGLCIGSTRTIKPEIPRYWPDYWKRWVVGVTAVFLLIPTGYFLFMAYQRQSIKTAVVNLSQPITTWELEEIGLLPQPGVSPLEPFPDYVYHIQISQNGRWALLKHEKRVDLFDLTSLQVAQTFAGEYMEVAFSPAGSRFVVINPSTYSSQEVQPYILLYDVEKGDVLWRDETIRAFAGGFLLDGAELFLVGREKAWQVAAVNGRIVDTISLTAYVEQTTSPDGNLTAVQNGNEITIHTTSQLQPLAKFPPDEVTAAEHKLLTFLTNEEVLTILIPSNRPPYQVLIWNFYTGHTTFIPAPAANRELSPDGRFAIPYDAWGGDILNAWNIQTEERLPWPAETAVGAAAFTPDQKLLILATFDGYLRFFAQDTP